MGKKEKPGSILASKLRTGNIKQKYFLETIFRRVFR